MHDFTHFQQQHCAARRLLVQCRLWHSCSHGRPTACPVTDLPSLTDCMARRQSSQLQDSMISVRPKDCARSRKQCNGALSLSVMRQKVQSCKSVLSEAGSD